MLRHLIPLLLLPGALFAQDDKVTSAVLDNGMEVVVIEDNRTPAVTHMVWYRVGSADEPPGVSGIAHFVEHLLFKATDDAAAGEFGEVVAANGGTDNAFTSYDYTGYFQRVAADRLELMMQYEADRMNDLALTPEDIETERDVILEERSQRTDSAPGALAREQLRAAQYLNHRYGVPIIGWRHEMEELDMDDVLSFYEAHYAPNNAILVVAGDVDPAEVLALAEAHYGVLPSESQVPERLRSQEPPQRAARRLTFEDSRVAQPYLIRSYLAPERDPGDQETAAALLYLSELLGGSPFTSAFGQALQFDTDTAVFAGAGYSPLALDDTTFSVWVAPSDGVTMEAAEAAMDAVIVEFMQTGPTEEDMARIRTRLKAEEIYDRDDVGGLARKYGAALSIGLSVADVQDWPRVLQNVTAQDVLAAAEEVFQTERSATIYVSAPAPQEVTQ